MTTATPTRPESQNPTALQQYQEQGFILHKQPLLEEVSFLS